MKMSTKIITTAVLNEEELISLPTRKLAKKMLNSLKEKGYYRETLVSTKERVETVYAVLNVDDEIVFEHIVEETVL